MNELVEYLDNGGDPNAFRESGVRLLWHYCEDLECVRLLLERGADPNKPQYQFSHYFNAFAIEICVSKLLYEQAKLLIRYGSNVNLEDDYGTTLLHGVDDEELIKMLIQKGIDVNRENKFGITPIGSAINRSNRQTIEILMKHRAKIKPDETSIIRACCPAAYHKWVRGRWILIRCCVKLLSLHKRAVITANHPLRKLARSEFEV